MPIILKPVLHILLVALFLCQALSTTFILVNFEINREEIAKTLCVKKDEVNNCCKGNCCLKKQLQAEEKKQQTPARGFKQAKQFPLFYDHQTVFAFHPTQIIESDFLPFQSLKTNSFVSSVFHPPC